MTAAPAAYLTATRAAAILLAAARLACGQPAPRYPAWFLTMPALSGGLTAVGYADMRLDVGAAAATAGENARRQLALARRTAVSAELLMEMVGGQREYRGERFDETPLDSAITDAAELDTAQVGTMVLVLAGTARDAPVDRRPVTLADSAPAWVRRPPAATADGEFSVGSAPLYYYEQHSWAEAELHARRAAAFAAVTHQRALSTRANDERAAASAVSTAVILEDAQIVARWRDTDLVYVLLRVGRIREPGDPARD